MLGRRCLQFSALSILAIPAIAPQSAVAACSTNTPADGTTVECMAPGTDTIGVSGNDNITVNVRNGALIDPAGVGVEGIDMRNGATILVENGAEIDTLNNFAEAIRVVNGANITINGLLDAYRGIGFGFAGFSNSMITIGSTGHVGSTATAGFGLDGGGGGNTYVVNGAIDTSGNSATAIIAGTGDNITIGSGGVVRTRSDPGSAPAIDADGFPSASGISVFLDTGSLIETFGGSSAGLQLGSAANVTVNGAIKTAQINPANPLSSGAAGIIVDGSSNITVGPSGSIKTSFAGSPGGQVGHGIQTTVSFGSPGGTTVNMNGMLETFGDISHGISASQNDVISVGSGATVATNGATSHGIFFQTLTFAGTDTADITVNGNIDARGVGSGGIFLLPQIQPLTATISIGSTGAVTSAQSTAIAGAQGSSLNPIFPDADITLKVAGTVKGPNATALAIDLNDGDDTLELQPGFSITGLVSGGTQAGQTDTFSLGGSGSDSFNVSLVDGNNTPTAGEQFRDFELFSKEGVASWILTGTNNEIAAFSVNGGTLINNALMTNTAFTIAPGTSLRGIGTAGGLVANGTVAPGNSIGTFNVAGNVLFNAGSLYLVEVASNGTSDLLNVTGSTTINGGTVQVQTLDPALNFAKGQKFTIITSAGGVNGRFSGVVDQSAFLEFLLGYDPNSVFLTLSKIADFGSVARTFNQIEVARALQSLDTINNADAGVVGNILLGLGADAARSAYDSIQGEIHADSRFMAVDANGLFNRLLMTQAENASGGSSSPDSDAQQAYAQDRKRSSSLAMSTELAYGAILGRGRTANAAPGHVKGWGSGFGSTTRVAGDGNAAKWTSGSFGLASGVEFEISDFTSAGMAAGYSRTSGDVTARSQSAEISNYHIGLYGRMGAARLENGLSFRTAASYAYYDIDTVRNIAFAGISRTAVAQYNGHSFVAAAEAQYGVRFEADIGQLNGTTIISPLAGINVSYSGYDGFAETGAASLNLSSSGVDVSAGFFALGMKVEGDYRLGGVALRPRHRLVYERTFGQNMPSAVLSLAGSPATFAVHGPDESRDRLRLGSALDVKLSERAVFNLSADALFSNDRTGFSARAGFRLTF